MRLCPQIQLVLFHYTSIKSLLIIPHFHTIVLLLDAPKFSLACLFFPRVTDQNARNKYFVRLKRENKHRLWPTNDLSLVFCRLSIGSLRVLSRVFGW